MLVPTQYSSTIYYEKFVRARSIFIADNEEFFWPNRTHLKTLFRLPPTTEAPRLMADVLQISVHLWLDT